MDVRRFIVIIPTLLALSACGVVSPKKATTTTVPQGSSATTVVAPSSKDHDLALKLLTTAEDVPTWTAQLAPRDTDNAEIEWQAVSCVGGEGARSVSSADVSSVRLLSPKPENATSPLSITTRVRVSGTEDDTTRNVSAFQSLDYSNCMEKTFHALALSEQAAESQGGVVNPSVSYNPVTSKKIASPDGSTNTYGWQTTATRTASTGNTVSHVDVFLFARGRYEIYVAFGRNGAAPAATAETPILALVKNRSQQILGSG